ncbi:MAG: hypothetical protein HY738_16790 [Bacteroidia bacterium]|nr:hypothetical protein [Bacteroidia bacterium]
MTRNSLSLLTCAILFSCNAPNVKRQSAEDNWGNKIDFESVIAQEKPTVVVPFSTSNCGYCLMDGFFTEKNYIETNKKFGGESYHQCLFNPQLDIYTFEKHFRWTSPTLTYPASLHDYHKDGFPALLAFRGGKQIISDFYNYAKFDSLKEILWNENVTLIPTGDLHITNAFINENEIFGAVFVVPGDHSISAGIIENGNKWRAYSCKHITALSQEDLQKHLSLTGKFTFTEMKQFFSGHSIPVQFENNRIYLGNYSYDYDSTGLYACFPSPFNKEKYLLISLYSDYAECPWQSNYIDYIIYTGKGVENAKRLLYGHFDKSTDYDWKFCEAIAFSDVEKSHHCIHKCRMPEKSKVEENQAYEINHEFSEDKGKQIWTLGNSNCRFPEIVVDEKGNCIAAWEEEGNILLAEIKAGDEVNTLFIENNETDSYNPKVVNNGDRTWIFYLNNQDRYYRLYAKIFDGLRVSDEILISGTGPFDVITPDVVSDGKDEMTAGWCEWKANFRYLKYRTIDHGIPKEIQDVQTTLPVYTDDKYVNAWYPSLCYDNTSTVWGAWNQHYPAIFGVCAGRLDTIASPVTRQAAKMDDWENGGYADIFIDKTNHKFITWESFGWNIYEGKSQKIKISGFDEESGKWKIGEVISDDRQTQYNQTPSGACTSQDIKYVVWSGRSKADEASWGIFLSVCNDNIWSEPELISPPDENARHPKIVADKQDHVWISWHVGIGNGMRVKVLRLK